MGIGPGRLRRGRRVAEEDGDAGDAERPERGAGCDDDEPGVTAPKPRREKVSIGVGENLRQRRLACGAEGAEDDAGDERPRRNGAGCEEEERARTGDEAEEACGRGPWRGGGGGSGSGLDDAGELLGWRRVVVLRLLLGGMGIGPGRLRRGRRVAEEDGDAGDAERPERGAGCDDDEPGVTAPKPRREKVSIGVGENLRQRRLACGAEGAEDDAGDERPRRNGAGCEEEERARTGDEAEEACGRGPWRGGGGGSGSGLDDAGELLGWRRVVVLRLLVGGMGTGPGRLRRGRRVALIASLGVEDVEPVARPRRGVEAHGSHRVP
ncbi:hypothetical protein ACP70R_033220 [Stipagrostis hirtigluma subsp. patula]